MTSKISGNSIHEELNQWNEEALEPSLRKHPEGKGPFSTTSLKSIERLYTPEDLSGQDFSSEIGFQVSRRM